MNEILNQTNKLVTVNQSKISGSKENVLRPPFGVDDPFEMLARFKASRHSPTTTIDSSHAYRKKRIQPRQFEVNPNMKTMYQYQFNDSADLRLGYCDERSVEDLNRQFKRCQQSQRNMWELFKLNTPELPPKKYRSDYNKRISEYAAEICYVGSKFLSNKIHDHSSCGRLPKHCVHYIEF